MLSTRGSGFEPIDEPIRADLFSVPPVLVEPYVAAAVYAQAPHVGRVASPEQPLDPG